MRSGSSPPMTRSRSRSCRAAASRYSTRPRWQTQRSMLLGYEGAEMRQRRLGVERAGEEEALPVVAAERLQRVPLVLGLDALGDDRELQRRAEADDAGGQGGRAVAQEGAVQLEDVGRQAGQGGHGRG